jgi:hypothetical protein
MRANWTSSFVSLGVRPNHAVNADVHRRRLRAVLRVAG